MYQHYLTTPSSPCLILLTTLNLPPLFYTASSTLPYRPSPPCPSPSLPCLALSYLPHPYYTLPFGFSAPLPSPALPSPATPCPCLQLDLLGPALGWKVAEESQGGEAPKAATPVRVDQLNYWLFRVVPPEWSSSSSF